MPFNIVRSGVPVVLVMAIFANGTAFGFNELTVVIVDVAGEAGLGCNFRKRTTRRVADEGNADFLIEARRFAVAAGAICLRMCSNEGEPG